MGLELIAKKPHFAASFNVPRLKGAIGTSGIRLLPSGEHIKARMALSEAFHSKGLSTWELSKHGLRRFGFHGGHPLSRLSHGEKWMTGLEWNPMRGSRRPIWREKNVVFDIHRRPPLAFGRNGHPF